MNTVERIAEVSSGINGVSMFLLLVLVIGLAFLPSMIAIFRGHHNALGVVILNVFLGWTYIGWVIALIWACIHIPKPAANPFGRSSSDLEL